MKLYHGTNIVFDKIDLRKSKPNKDFGQGFYLSPDYNQALNMANIKTEQLQEGEPTVMEFEVEVRDIRSLHTLVFDDYSENWAEFILANQQFSLHSNPQLRHRDRAYSQRSCRCATMEIQEPSYRHAYASMQAEIYERNYHTVFLWYRNSIVYT